MSELWKGCPNFGKGVRTLGRVSELRACYPKCCIGMYGGFNFNLDVEEWVLVVDSFCRVVGGSEQTHVIHRSNTSIYRLNRNMFDFNFSHFSYFLLKNRGFFGLIKYSLLILRGNSKKHYNATFSESQGIYFTPNFPVK